MSATIAPPAPPRSASSPALPGPSTGLQRSLGPTRARIAILFAAYLVVGSTACGIFDRFETAVVLAPTLPALGAFAFAGRTGMFRLVSAIVTIVATTALAVLSVGGGPGDVVDAFTSGLQGLLSTEWPSPNRPELVGAVAAALAAGMALSAELATRRRFHLMPLAPLVVTYGWALALSAPLGVNWLSVVAIGALCTVFSMFRNEGGLRDRLVLLSGERRLIPLLAFVAVLGALITVPITLSDRANPRHNDPATRSATLLDPIEATLALRALDPPVDLHVITSRTDEPLPLRWRTAALTDYDGARWRPALTLRPIGRTLGPITGPVVDADITFLDDDLSLVPLPGPPVTVDAAVETDADRTVVRLLERPDVGQVVSVVANRSPTREDAVGATVMSRFIVDDVSTLSELAASLAGDGSPLDQLIQLESTMRNDFVLDESVPGGGLQRAFIERFLRDTKRGNSEQFVTGFVLLARSLGVEARVATGFVAGSPANGALPLSSSDARIWPEVQLADGTWLAFDPVPEEAATDVAPPPPEPQTQSPAAPQPPIAPPPDPESEDTPTEETDPAESDGTLSRAFTLVLRSGAVAVIILLPFVLAAAVILAAKYRRRKRRLTAADANDRIRGAWASATDALVDAGLTIRASSTDAQIAGDGETVASDARRDLHRLATLSSAATFGTHGHLELAAEEAIRCLDSIEQTVIADRRTRRHRLRWRLSLRSLRAATRSPVTV